MIHNIYVINKMMRKIICLDNFGATRAFGIYSDGHFAKQCSYSYKCKMCAIMNLAQRKRAEYSILMTPKKRLKMFL
jgi:hypothetical protein